MNSRHPDPRRVWKVGSGARLLPPLRWDPRDPRDSRENSETFIFEHPSITFGQKVGKAPPGSASGRSGGPAGLWVSSGSSLGSFGKPLGACLRQKYSF